jgi:hypothetical protein
MLFMPSSDFIISATRDQTRADPLPEAAARNWRPFTDARFFMAIRLIHPLL